MSYVFAFKVVREDAKKLAILRLGVKKVRLKKLKVQEAFTYVFIEDRVR